MAVRFPEEEFTKLKKMLITYQWGLQTLLTKVSIIFEDYEYFSENNPIENVRTRIKDPESIAEKLYRWGHALTTENAKLHIKDIAGIRITCTYSRDIAELVSILRQMPNVTVLEEKDYVNNPKPSGYRGYHIYTETPVFFSKSIENIPVEIQIRTSAMDFWATLEHKAKYKHKTHIPEHLSDELIQCANTIADVDERMFTLHNVIKRLKPES